MLKSIFIHYNNFWLSFALDISFFLIGLLTCSSTWTLPFCFIIVLVPNFGRLGIMLELGPFSKSSWRNASPLFTCCYSSFSSTSLGIGTSCGCSSTTGCYNSPSSTSLDVGIDCEISSTTGLGLISISSSEFEITMTCGINFVIDVVVLLGKFCFISNSSSNSLLLCSCSKNLISFVVCAHETSSSTQITLDNQTCFVFFLQYVPS